MLGTIAAPALARATAAYSDAELVRAIRHGVRKDGSALYVMPTDAHGFLADEDVARIVAWIRSLGPRPDDSLAVTRAGAFGQGADPRGQDSVERAPRHRLHAGPPGGQGPVLRPMSSAPPATRCRSRSRRMTAKAWPPPSPRWRRPMIPPPSASCCAPASARRGRDLGLMKMISVQALQALSDDEIAQIQA